MWSYQIEKKILAQHSRGKLSEEKEFSIQQLMLLRDNDRLGIIH